jgi:hypothetical protein
MLINIEFEIVQHNELKSPMQVKKRVCLSGFTISNDWNLKYIIEAQTTIDKHCCDWAVGSRKCSSLLQVSLIAYVASTILKVWSNTVPSDVTSNEMHQTILTLQLLLLKHCVKFYWV